jgi:hypothetical protein
MDESCCSLKDYVDRLFKEQQVKGELAAEHCASLLAAEHRSVEAALRQIDHRIETMKILVSERVDAVRREATVALAASEKAITKSESASERRFDSVNEFREQLSDQASHFMPREVAESKIDDLRRSADTRMDELRVQMGDLQRRIDQSAGESAGSARSISYMLAGVGSVLTFVAFASQYWPPR